MREEGEMINLESIPFVPLNTFVGFSNYPNQVRKREVQIGFRLNILIAGKFEIILR